MNRDAAIEAGARVLNPGAFNHQWHNDDFQRAAQADARGDVAAVIDAALPHLVGEPVGYGVVTPLGRALSVCATLDGAQHLRDLISEDSEGGLRVVALIPVVEP